MDKYSFLNAAHTTFFADLYDKYLKAPPDSVEPSWRAFFQGFDLGSEIALDELDVEAVANGSVEQNGQTVEVPQSLQKEFQVIRLIDGYRSRGHLFTETNPVRERRKYEPTLRLKILGFHKPIWVLFLMLVKLLV